jgi:hypothetical protein
MCFDEYEISKIDKDVLSLMGKDVFLCDLGHITYLIYEFLTTITVEHSIWIEFTSC